MGDPIMPPDQSTHLLETRRLIREETRVELVLPTAILSITSNSKTLKIAPGSNAAARKITLPAGRTISLRIGLGPNRQSQRLATVARRRLLRFGTMTTGGAKH